MFYMNFLHFILRMSSENNVTRESWLLGSGEAGGKFNFSPPLVSQKYIYREKNISVGDPVYTYL